MSDIDDDPTDRRARILDAALSEFAEQGYFKASTTAIAARAGVAKGLVFHYFKNKEDLFVEVVAGVTAAMIPLFEQTMRDAPPEIFARMQAWTRAKLGAIRDDPRRFRLMIFAMSEAPQAVVDRTRIDSETMMRTALPLLTAGLDKQRLRVGISAADVVESMFAVSAGLERTFMTMLHAARTAPAGEDGSDVLDVIGRKVERLFAILRAGSYRDDDVD